MGDEAYMPPTLTLEDIGSMEPTLVSEPPRPSPYRWLIFGILALSYLLVYFHRMCPAIVAVDLMTTFKTGGALLGVLASAYFYPYALMQIPGGLLSDSLGPRKTVSLFLLLSFVGSVLFGLAPTLPVAIFARVLVGLGVSVVFVPTLKILSQWFRPREFASMTGILMLVGGIGVLSAASPLAVLTGWLGWRRSFVAIGGLSLILSALVWMIVRDRPRSVAASTSDEERREGGRWEGMWKVVTTGSFWPLAVWFFFDCAIFFSFGGLWGAPYLMQVHGLTKPQTGAILNMMAVGMIVGSPLLGFLSDRVFVSRKVVMVGSTGITVGVVAPLAFFTGQLTIPMLYGLCFFMGVFANAIVVVGFTSVKELFPRSIAGTSTGTVNLFPFAGGAVYQPLMGYVLERTGRVGDLYTVEGYQNAFVLLFAAAVIAFVATWFMKETLKKVEA